MTNNGKTAKTNSKIPGRAMRAGSNGNGSAQGPFAEDLLGHFGGASWREAMVPFMAVVIGLLFGAVMMLILGANPLKGYLALLIGSFGSKQNFAETIVSITPLIFTGLSVAFAFRCGLFNIGGEGQIIVGMVASAVVGAYVTGLPRIIHLPLVILAGTLAGAIWGLIPGFLKATRGVHEVVNTIMLNWIALYVSHYLVNGPIKDPAIPVPATPEVADTAKLLRFLDRSNTGILIAIACAFLVYWILWRTSLGYEIRAVGLNPEAARYAGISVPKNMMLAMAISGGLAGLAGTVQVIGVQHKFLDLFAFEGYGFDGIAVALVGKNHPFGVLLSAVLFGTLARGSQTMQGMAGIPKETVGVVQAAIIFLVAADGIVRSLLKMRSRAAARPAALDTNSGSPGAKASGARG